MDLGVDGWMTKSEKFWLMSGLMDNKSLDFDLISG